MDQVFKDLYFEANGVPGVFYIYGPHQYVMFFTINEVKLLWDAITKSPDDQVAAILVKESGSEVFINHFDKIELTYRNN